MSRPKLLVPKMCVDKSRNRAFCRVDGKFIVLGPAGIGATQIAYGNVLKALEERRKLGLDPVCELVPAEPKPSVLLN